MKPDDLLNLTEAASLLGVSARQLRRNVGPGGVWEQLPEPRSRSNGVEYQFRRRRVEDLRDFDLCLLARVGWGWERNPDNAPQRPPDVSVKMWDQTPDWIKKRGMNVSAMSCFWQSFPLYAKGRNAKPIDFTLRDNFLRNDLPPAEDVPSLVWEWATGLARTLSKPELHYVAARIVASLAPSVHFTDQERRAYDVAVNAMCRNPSKKICEARQGVEQRLALLARHKDFGPPPWPPDVEAQIERQLQSVEKVRSLLGPGHEPESVFLDRIQKEPLHDPLQAADVGVFLAALDKGEGAGVFLGENKSEVVQEGGAWRKRIRGPRQTEQGNADLIRQYCRDYGIDVALVRPLVSVSRKMRKSLASVGAKPLPGRVAAFLGVSREQGGRLWTSIQRKLRTHDGAMSRTLPHESGGRVCECGVSVNDDSRFCPECGQAVAG